MKILDYRLKVRKKNLQGLLVLLLMVLIPVLYTGSVTAKNYTFTPFKRSDYPTYLNDRSAIAKEIAYYANYIIPILGSRADGCLGARQTDSNVFREDEQNKDDKDANVAHHVSRCSYLFPSDYARLNYIVALNANFKGALNRQNGTLRYISRTSSPEDYGLSDNFQADSSTPTNTPNNQTSSGGKSSEITRKIVNDTDAEYVKNTIGFKAASPGEIYIPTTKILPIGKGLSEAKIEIDQLKNYFIPNLRLSREDNAELFGFNNNQVSDYYMRYGYMYYNVINYALKDCGQSSLAKLTPKNDSVVNQRAVMLNPENVIGEVLTERLKKLDQCKNKCDSEENKSDDDNDDNTTTAVPANQVSKCLSDTIKDTIDKFSEENNSTNFNKVSSKEIASEIVAFTDDIAIRFKDNLKNGMEGKNALAQAFKENHVTNLFDDNNITKMLLNKNNITPFLKEEIKQKLIYDIMELGDKFLKCGTDFAEVNSKCVDECNRSYGLNVKQPTPNCSLLTRVLQQVDTIERANNFVSNTDISYQRPKWLPLTDDEKHIMGFGDTSRLGQGGDTDIDPDFKLHEPYKSTCYFTGFSSFICTFTNFFAWLADSAFHNIENLMRFPSSTLDSSTGEYNFYSSWKIFRDLANIVLIIVLIISIIAQISGWRLDQIGLRRALPKILVAGVMVNLSFYICQIVVDFSNMLGSSIYSFVNQGTGVLLKNTEFYNTSNQNPPIVALTGVIMAGLVVGGLYILLSNLFLIIPVIFSFLITLATNIFILIFRQVLVFLLILTAPIIFAASALSPNNSLVKRWWQMLSAVLLAYPLIAFGFSVGNIAYEIVQNTVVASASDEWLKVLFQILALSLLIMPISLVPKVMQNIIKNLPIIGAQIAGIGSHLSQNAQKRLNSTKFIQQARSNKALKKLNRHRQDDADEDTQKWLKERDDEKFSYKSSLTPQDALNDVRNFNKSKGSQKDINSITSALLNVADSGDGSYEDAILAFNKLSSLNLSPQKLQALKGLVIDNYKTNGRFDVAGLLEKASETDPTFNFGSNNDPKASLDKINQAVYGTTNTAAVQAHQTGIIQEAYTNNTNSSLISGPKFKGFKSGPDKTYGNETSLLAAHDAVRNLYNTDNAFKAALDLNNTARRTI